MMLKQKDEIEEGEDGRMRETGRRRKGQIWKDSR